MKWRNTGLRCREKWMCKDNYCRRASGNLSPWATLSRDFLLVSTSTRVLGMLEEGSFIGYGVLDTQSVGHPYAPKKGKPYATTLRSAWRDRICNVLRCILFETI